MEKSSSSAGKHRSAQTIVFPVFQQSPLGPFPLDAPKGKPKSASQRLVECLHQPEASTQAIAQCLQDMGTAHPITLDLSGQTLSIEAVLRLAQVFHEHPELLRPFSAFNFSGARLDVLWPLLDALKNQLNGSLLSLDFSGTCVLDPDTLGEKDYVPLPDADLRRIIALVEQYPMLVELKLNQQPGLAPPAHARQLNGFIDRTSPMFALVGALYRSSVETLELRDCELWAADVNYLDPETLRHEIQGCLRLRSIDLRGNDGMYGSFDSLVLRSEMVIGMVTGLARNPDMRELYLPANTFHMLGDDNAVFALTLALEQTASRELVRLEPFSSSASDRFAGLYQWLSVKPGSVPVVHTASDEHPNPQEGRTDTPQLGAPNPIDQQPVPSGGTDETEFVDLVWIDTLAPKTAGQDEPPVSAAATASRQLLDSFNEGDDQAVIERLKAMQAKGITTLEWRGQYLNAKAVDCIERIWQNGALIDVFRSFTSVDFGDAKVEGELSAWFAVLEGGAIRSLNLSGARSIRFVSSLGRLHECPLHLFYLHGFHGVPAVIEKCRHLQELELDDQFSIFHQFYQVTKALEYSSVEKLTMRNCALREENLDLLRDHIRSKVGTSGCRLRSLDLRGNPCSPSMISILLDHAENQYLEELYLPFEALHEDGILAFKLMFALESSAKSTRIKLESVLSLKSEFSSQCKQRLKGLFADVDQSEEAKSAHGAVISVACAQVVLCLGRDNVQGAIICLRLMQELGVKPFDFSPGESHCDAQTFKGLAKVLDEQPSLFTGSITGFDFSSALVESVSFLPAVLKRHLNKGGRIERLSFYKVNTIKSIEHPNRGVVKLKADELIGIAESVKQCPTLRELHLGQQPGLSSERSWTDIFSRPTAKDWPMLAMTEALGASSVEKVSFVHCDLRSADVELLNACVRRRRPGSGLRSINLYGSPYNLFKGTDAFKLVISLVKAHPDLEELTLPDFTWANWNPSNSKLAQADKSIAQAIVQSKKSKLVSLYPLSGSDITENFPQVNKALADNAARQKT